MPTTPQVFTIEKAAALLECHPETVRREIRDGKLKAARIGRDYRISRHQLEEYWRAQGGGQLFEDEQEATVHAGQASMWDLPPQLPATKEPAKEEPHKPAPTHDQMSREDKIAMILDLLNGGMTYQQVAETLERRGVPTSKGNMKWHRGSVHAMVRNYPDGGRRQP
jgi:excisionase family DNA binding protein